MFGVDDVLLATLAAQVGSAVFNSYRGNRHSKELAAKQQALEEKIQKDGMQNAREEFAALCSLQREIEQEMQRDRIDMIKSNHANAILEKAYSVALDKWPLLVPPYVVKNECLLNIEQGQRDVLPLNCIMTTSMDSNFNKSIFPNVEEAIAEFCYTYWNVASERCIRFYQRAWKDNITDIGAECRNLHALMKDVPTLVLSPQVRHEKLTFRFFWWGLSTSPQDVHIDDNSVFDPELSNPVYEGMKYSDDDIRIILSELIPKIEAFISYFADLYYWNYYRRTPSLPKLLYSAIDSLGIEDKSEYNNRYKTMLADYSRLGDSLSSVSKLCDLLISTKNSLQQENELMTIVEERIELKKSRGSLNSAEIPFLQQALENFKLSPSHQAKVTELISNLKTAENIGFMPCAGRNELLQKLHNICHQTGATFAHIKTVSPHIGIVTFTIDDKQIYSADGLRFYIAVYPMMDMVSDAIFDNSLLRLTKEYVGKHLFADFFTMGIANSEMDSLLNQQTNLLHSCSMVFDKLEEDIKGSNLALIDLSYENLKEILAKQYKSTLIPEGYVAIAYSASDDCYYISILQYNKDEKVAAEYNCRSNSIATSLYNKINNKAILKINIK